MPSKLVKASGKGVQSPLVDIINLSFEIEVFQERLKETIAVSRLNLLFLGKITERPVAETFRHSGMMYQCSIHSRSLVFTVAGIYR